MASDVKWIKITTDIFDDEKILLIESLPDANSIIVVWFKLLCLAGKQNNSGVFMMANKIAYTDKMLATIFRMKETTVQLALQTFEQFGMVEIIDGVITIPNWGKHQNLDQLESKKEYMRNYMKDYREKQRLLTGKSSCKANSKANVSEADIEEDKEREKEGDKEIYKEIISFLNEKTGKNFRPNTGNTKSLINARLEEGYTIDDFKTVIEKKCNDWLNDPKMEKYLRPTTLFALSKFEGYLNEKPRKGGVNGADHERTSRIAEGVGTWL